jgi:hypothetical protein
MSSIIDGYSLEAFVEDCWEVVALGYLLVTLIFTRRFGCLNYSALASSFSKTMLTDFCGMAAVFCCVYKNRVT